MKKFTLKSNSFKQAFTIMRYMVAFIALGFVIWNVIKIRNDLDERERIKGYPFELMRQEAELSYSENKGKLVKVVDDYIKTNAPNSSLSGYCIVTNCEKYDLDIKFVLAQGQVESGFGTKGLAVKTNSVFNVGAYDNKTYEEVNGKYKYKHPDFSVEPYMQLLYKDYISGTTTELDLLAKYVNKNGKRYATNPNYERDLLIVYKLIIDIEI